MKRSKASYLPIAFIVLLSLFFQFIYLDRIPTAMSGDELIYALTAKSVFLTGHDIMGTWNPLSALLFRHPASEQQAELPYFIHLFFSAPFPFSLLSAKLPFAVLSIGIVILLFLIAHILFGRPAAIATGLVAAVNPWLVVMGRTGYESTPATFFYLLALLVLLKARGSRILFTIIPLVFAFYSYIATKVILVPFVAVASYLAYHMHKRQHLRQYLVLCAACVLIVIAFILFTKVSPAESRLGDLLLPTHPSIVSRVDQIRSITMASPVTPFFINKYVIFGETILTKLLRVFSSSFLFAEGDQFFLGSSRGFFYYFEALFVILGALTLFVKNKSYLLAIFAFLLVGALPQLVHKNTSDFSIHLALFFPFLILLTGVGITASLELVPKRLRSITLGTIVVLYLSFVGSFATIYFYQVPLLTHADFPMRILTRYAKLARERNIPIIIFSARTSDFFKKYLFYANAMNKGTMPEISHIGNTSPFSFEGIYFTTCTDKQVATASATAIYDVDCGQFSLAAHLSITKLSDAGEVYKIYNDQLCNAYELARYPTGITFNDLVVEQLPEKEFCETYVSRGR